jgi:Spy/CpxP family protein refolding chaperone
MRHTFTRFAAAAALAAGMAFAQAPAAGNVGRSHARAGRMFQQLNLTDAQKAQAKTVFQQARQSSQALMQQLKTNREALGAAVKANNVAQIDTLAKEQGILHGQLLAVRSEAMAKVYATLTPEQKAKADELRQQRHERMKERFQHRKANNG